MKKTILIDLDGVLNNYTGNFNEENIPAPNKEAFEFLAKLSQNYKVKLFTARKKHKAKQWLVQHSLDKYISEITDKKELAWVYIDDRCINFNGNFNETYIKIENFKPWYKK